MPNCVREGLPTYLGWDWTTPGQLVYLRLVGAGTCRAYTGPLLESWEVYEGVNLWNPLKNLQ